MQKSQVSAEIIDIGNWTLNYSLQSINDGVETRELEPLSFKLLCYFINSQEAIVTRQELAENVWQQNFVDDNAINRAISELRKTLKSNNQPGVAIKTHYRKGYSFFLPIKKTPLAEQVNTNKTNAPANINLEQAQKKKSSANKKLLIWISISVFFCVCVYLSKIFYTRLNIQKVNSQPNHSVTITPLSWYQGVHYITHLSIDKRYLAYQLSELDGQDEELYKHIYIIDLATQRSYKVHLPIRGLLSGWSSDSKTIFFTEVRNNKINKEVSYCGIWKITNFITSHPDVKESVNCVDTDNISPNTFGLPNKTMAYSKNTLINKSQTKALFVYDVNTHIEQQITSPNNTGLGDVIVAITPSTNNIIFERHTRQGFSLFMVNQRGEKLTKLADLPERIWTATYDENEHSLTWFTRSDQQLYKINLKNLKLSTPSTIEIQSSAYVYPLTQSTILTTSYPYTYDAYEYNLDNNQLTPFARPSIEEHTLYYLGNYRYLIGNRLNSLENAFIEVKKGIYKPFTDVDASNTNILDMELEHNSVLVYNKDKEIHEIRMLPSFALLETFAKNKVLHFAKLNGHLVAAVEQNDKLDALQLVLYDFSRDRSNKISIGNVAAVDWLTETKLLVLSKDRILRIYDINKNSTIRTIQLDSLNPNFVTQDSLNFAASDNKVFISSENGKIFRLDLSDKITVQEILDISDEIGPARVIINLNAEKNRLLFSVIKFNNNEILLYQKNRE